MSKATVYQIVTDRILKKLEAGVIPWRKPWVARSGLKAIKSIKTITRPVAVNWNTQRPYRGINQMLLDPGEYATYNQIEKAGGKVKKGEHASVIVFWKWLEKPNEETGETERIPYLRYYNVFEINSQVDGLKSKVGGASPTETTTETTTALVPVEPEPEPDPIETAEIIMTAYKTCPPIKHDQANRAYYSPGLDYINTPPMACYPVKEEYYSTLFHEAVHSTGHKDRLNRDGVARGAVAFGDETYSKEELVAEIGAAMLCGIAGIENATIDNQAAYIKSWHKRLKEDPRMIVFATGAAQKAADYILGDTWDQDEPLEGGNAQ